MDQSGFHGRSEIFSTRSLVKPKVYGSSILPERLARMGENHVPVVTGV